VSRWQSPNSQDASATNNVNERTNGLFEKHSPYKTEETRKDSFTERQRERGGRERQSRNTYTQITTFTAIVGLAPIAYYQYKRNYTHYYQVSYWNISYEERDCALCNTVSKEGSPYQWRISRVGVIHGGNWGCHPYFS